MYFLAASIINLHIFYCVYSRYLVKYEKRDLKIYHDIYTGIKCHVISWQEQKSCFIELWFISCDCDCEIQPPAHSLCCTPSPRLNICPVKLAELSSKARTD